jgi:hypothetical protein
VVPVCVSTGAQEFAGSIHIAVPAVEATIASPIKSSAALDKVDASA